MIIMRVWQDFPAFGGTRVKMSYGHCLHWCRRQSCMGCNHTPKTFDLVKIWVKSLKIRAKSVEIRAKFVKTFTKSLYVLWFHKIGTQNQSADILLFWLSSFYVVLFGRGKFGKNGAWSVLWFKNMKRNVVFFHFFWRSFSLEFCWGKFGELAPTPMMVCTTSSYSICICNNVSYYLKALSLLAGL